VVAKGDLLRSVWRDPTADPHVVEVAVARLRKRLQPVGLTLEAVHRRGYRIIEARTARC
jgi:DNA-binding winged helix-turn-helix (wHTH) protein